MLRSQTGLHRLKIAILVLGVLLTGACVAQPDGGAVATTVTGNGIWDAVATADAVTTTAPQVTPPAPSATRTAGPAGLTPRPLATASPRDGATPRDGLTAVSEQDLPREARTTLHLISEGGPFPFDKDGSVFQNRERLLPNKPRGYYREYTVITPGENDRGARRIVAGENGELYYTDDHYNSFKRVTP
jgi:ribonuclease T1